MHIIKTIFLIEICNLKLLFIKKINAAIHIIKTIILSIGKINEIAFAHIITAIIKLFIFPLVKIFSFDIILFPCIINLGFLVEENL